MAKKIAFINNKGGSGKTTSTVNIAGAYATRFPDRKILIVECDGQSNASISFGVMTGPVENTMYDVFLGLKPASECIMETSVSNIDLLPSNTDMYYVEFDRMKEIERHANDRSYQTISEYSPETLATFSQSEWHTLLKSDLPSLYFNMLKGKFDELEKDYDLILFDTPPELKAVTTSVLAIIDEVIIPFEPDIYSASGINNILDRIVDIKKDYNPKLEIAGIIAMKVKRRTSVHIRVINDVMKFSNMKELYYFQTEIPNTIRFASATTMKRLPATITQKNNELVNAYYDLLDEMLHREII